MCWPDADRSRWPTPSGPTEPPPLRRRSDVNALLAQKVVLVSGGTLGVGAGIARAAAREGAAVAVTGRRRDPGESLVAELLAAGATARFVQADVGDVGQALGS